MSTYSLSGYLSALTVRENRTVLVEGKDDKKVISGLMLEYETSGARLMHPTVVDSVDLVRGDRIAVGNRALVELVHRKCVDTGLAIAAVVDREFRDFTFGSAVGDSIGDHATRDATIFWTRGHSMENYFFDARYFTRFIKAQFAESLETKCLTSCSSAFHEVLGWACAVSLALWDARYLEKGSGLARHAHWRHGASGDIELDVKAFCSAMQKRDVSQAAADLLGESIQFYHLMLTRSSAAERRYVAHGHVAYELIWCGLAAVMREAGSSGAVVDGVAYGYSDAKWRFMADLLAQDVHAGRETILPGLVHWLFGDLEAAA